MLMADGQRSQESVGRLAGQTGLKLEAGVDELAAGWLAGCIDSEHSRDPCLTGGRQGPSGQSDSYVSARDWPRTYCKSYLVTDCSKLNAMNDTPGTTAAEREQLDGKWSV